MTGAVCLNTLPPRSNTKWLCVATSAKTRERGILARSTGICPYSCQGLPTSLYVTAQRFRQERLGVRRVTEGQVGRDGERPAPPRGIQHRTALQPQCLRDAQQALHGAAALLAVAAERPLPLEHRRPQRPDEGVALGASRAVRLAHA